MNTTATVNPTLHNEPPSPNLDLTGISVGRSPVKRILVITDNWYDKAQAVLQSNGVEIQIRAVNDHEEALNALKEWQDANLSVDLITLDCYRVDDIDNPLDQRLVAPYYTEKIQR